MAHFINLFANVVFANKETHEQFSDKLCLIFLGLSSLVKKNKGMQQL